MRRFIGAKGLLRLAVSAALIGVLVWRYPITGADLRKTLTSVNPWLFALALVLLFNQTFLSSLKWQIILRSHEIRIPLPSLMRSYLIGSFFSSFLPSSYAGDLVRVVDVARGTGRTFESAAAVVLERLSGLAALTAVGSVAALMIGRAWDEPAFYQLAAVLLGVLLLLLAAFVPGATAVGRKLAAHVPVAAVGRLADKVDGVVRHYRSRPRLLVEILLISFAFQIMAYTIFFIHTRALDLPVPYLYCLAFVPVVYLLEALPISIAGIGLRESGLVFFLGKLGISASDAIALSILVMTARYGYNLMGGILLATRRKLPGSPASPQDVNRGIS